MSEQFKLILPLDINFQLKTKKDRKISFSLNSFLLDLSDKSYSQKRKISHHYEKTAKKHLQDICRQQLFDIPVNVFKDAEYPLKVELTIYRGSNRQSDMDNYAIIVKFAMDVVKESHIPDDNWRYIREIIIKDGGLDRENPRAELVIHE